jgi:hypothetical protein
MKPVTLSSPRFFMHGYRRLKQFTAILSLLVFPATWGNWGVLTAQEVSSLDADRLQSVIELIETMEALMREHTLTLDAVVDQFGADAPSIVEWVRINTRWVSYHGLLKGANATYNSGNGNLLDRSVLLAAMLKRAGTEVRLKRYQLSEAQIQQLGAAYQAQIPSIELKALPSFNREAIEPGVLERIAAENNLTKDALLASMAVVEDSSRREWQGLMDQVDAQSDVILSKLDEASPAAVSRFSEADYFLVEYENAGTWTRACSVFGSNIPEYLLVGQSHTYESSETLPEDLQHQVRVVLEIDQIVDGVLNTKTIVDRKWASAAVSNEQITVRLAGSGFARLGTIASDEKLNHEEKQQAMVETLAQEDKWVCTIVAGGASVQHGFDDKGDYYDVSADGTLSLGSKLKGAMGALSRLGGMDVAEPKKELVGVRFVFETLVPGRETVREEREVYAMDPASLAAAKAGEKLEPAIRSHRAVSCNDVNQILIQTSKWNMNQFAAVELDKYTKTRLAVQYYQRLLSTGRSQEFEKRYADIMAKIPSTDSLLSNLAIIRSVYPKQQDRIFLSQPNLVRSTASWSIDGDSFRERRAIDILVNAVDTLAQDATTARKDRVEMGVLDTLAEKQVVMQMLGSAAVANASSIFQGNPSSDAFSVLRQDTRNREGFLSLIKSGETSSWYRVDPVTGETLGMMEFGDRIIMGASATEYVIALISGVLTFFGCWAGPSGSAGNFAGCLACGIIAGIAAAIAAVYMMQLMTAWGAGATPSTGAMLAGRTGSAAGAGSMISQVCGAVMAVAGWAL